MDLSNRLRRVRLFLRPPNSSLSLSCLSLATLALFKLSNVTKPMLAWDWIGASITLSVVSSSGLLNVGENTGESGVGGARSSWNSCVCSNGLDCAFVESTLSFGRSTEASSSELLFLCVASKRLFKFKLINNITYYWNHFVFWQTLWYTKYFNTSLIELSISALLWPLIPPHRSYIP